MEKMFKNACRIHTEFMIVRYLMSNAINRWDGAEKALRHEELCKFYVAAIQGSTPDRVYSFEDDYQRLHEATRALTDNLDAVIGFPLDHEPDYDIYAPRFFEQFHKIAIDTLT
jgi:hypothetical protein